MMMNKCVLLLASAVTFLPTTILGQSEEYCFLDEDGTPLGLGAPVCEPFYAGQTTQVGEVCVTIVQDTVDTYFDFHYKLYSDWFLSEIHLWVDTDLNTMPRTKGHILGHPKLGLFPDKEENINLYDFHVDVSFPTGTTETACNTGPLYYYVAHAAVEKVVNGEVVQSETAFSHGTDFEGKRWGWYSTFEMTCCEVDDIPPAGGTSCVHNETAFALGPSKCFDDLGFKRWGWSVGPISSEEALHEFKIYAGAGQCDITKGTDVGDLIVAFGDSTISVTYQMSPPFLMEEAQIYVGSEILVRDENNEYTVAPGQYGNVREYEDGAKASDTFEFVNYTNEEFYVVAHANACGDYS